MFDLFQFGDYARQMSQWKVIPEGSVEGQASRSDARYLYRLIWSIQTMALRSISLIF